MSLLLNGDDCHNPAHQALVPEYRTLLEHCASLMNILDSLTVDHQSHAALTSLMRMLHSSHPDLRAAVSGSKLGGSSDPALRLSDSLASENVASTRLLAARELELRASEALVDDLRQQLTGVRRSLSQLESESLRSRQELENVLTKALADARLQEERQASMAAEVETERKRGDEAQSECRTLQRELSDSRRRADELAAALQRETEARTALATELDGQQRRNEKLTADCEELRARVLGLQARQDELLAAVQQAKELIGTLESERAQLNLTVERLRPPAEEAPRLRQALKTTEMERDGIAAELRDARARATALLADKEQLTTAKATLAGRLDDSNAKLTSAQEENKIVLARLSDATKDHAVAEAARREAVHKAEGSASEHAALKSEYTALDTRLRESGERLAELRATCQQLTSAKMALEADKTSLSGRLAARDAEAADYNSSLEKLRWELGQANTTQQSLRADLTRARDDVGALQHTLALAEARGARVEELIKQNENMASERRALDAEIIRLQNALSDALARLAVADADCAELREQSARLGAEREQITMRLQQSETERLDAARRVEELTRVEEEHVRAQQRIDDDRARAHATLQSEYAVLAERCRSLETQLDDAQAQLRQARESLTDATARLEAEMERMRSAGEATATQLREAMEALAEARSEAAAKTAEVAGCEREMKELRRELTNADDERTSLRRELNDSVEEQRRTQQRIADAELERVKMASDTTMQAIEATVGARAEAAVKAAEVAGAERELAELRRELAAAETEREDLRRERKEVQAKFEASQERCTQALLGEQEASRELRELRERSVEAARSPSPIVRRDGGTPGDMSAAWIENGALERSATSPAGSRVGSNGPETAEELRAKLADAQKERNSLRKEVADYVRERQRARDNLEDTMTRLSQRYEDLSLAKDKEISQLRDDVVKAKQEQVSLLSDANAWRRHQGSGPLDRSTLRAELGSREDISVTVEDMDGSTKGASTTSMAQPLERSSALLHAMRRLPAGATLGAEDVVRLAEENETLRLDVEAAKAEALSAKKEAAEQRRVSTNLQNENGNIRSTLMSLRAELDMSRRSEERRNDDRKKSPTPADSTDGARRMRELEEERETLQRKLDEALALVRRLEREATDLSTSREAEMSAVAQEDAAVRDLESTAREVGKALQAELGSLANLEAENKALRARLFELEAKKDGSDGESDGDTSGLCGSTMQVPLAQTGNNVYDISEDTEDGDSKRPQTPEARVERIHRAAKLEASATLNQRQGQDTTRLRSKLEELDGRHRRTLQAMQRLHDDTLADLRARLAELERAHAQLTQTHALLRSQYDSVTESLRATEADLERTRAQRADAQRELKRVLEDGMTAAQETQAWTTNPLLALQTQLRLKEVESQVHAGAHEQNAVALEAQLRDVRTERLRLEEALHASAEGRKTEHERAKARAADLERRLGESEREREHADAETRRLRKRVREAEERQRAAEATITQNELELRALKDRFKKELGEVMSLSADASQSGTGAGGSAEATIVALRSELRSLMELLHRTEQQRDHYKGQLEQLEDESRETELRHMTRIRELERALHSAQLDRDRIAQDMESANLSREHEIKGLRYELKASTIHAERAERNRQDLLEQVRRGLADFMPTRSPSTTGDDDPLSVSAALLQAKLNMRLSEVGMEQRHKAEMDALLAQYEALKG